MGWLKTTRFEKHFFGHHMALTVFWFAKRRNGSCIRSNADSASLILMGDWCSKADTVRNENPRSGEENVTEAMEVQKTIFCTIDYYLLLTGWPLMGDPYAPL